MATFFRNTVVTQLGTSPETIAETTPTSRITVIGLSLCNLTSATVKVSVQLTDSSSVTGYYIKDVVLPPFQSLRVVNGGEKLVMAESNSLKAFTDTASSVDVIASYVEIV
jgi:hypothetical protein